MKRLLRSLALRRHACDQAHRVGLEGCYRVVRDRALLAGRLVGCATKVLLGMHHHEADELLRLIGEAGKPDHKLRQDGLQNRIASKQLFQDYFDFRPVFCLHVGGPSVEETDHGIWRRMRKVPWPRGEG